MAILIKNPETERKARELAALRGQTITAALDGALSVALADTQSKRQLTVADIEAATDRFWKQAGVKGPFPPVTKEEWDEINEIPGLDEGLP